LQTKDATVLAFFFIMMGNKQQIQVLGSDISVFKTRDDDYISLTDIARYKDPERSDYILQNRMRAKNTIEYL
jgi:hypothetical protein